mmetsp:Transcript_21194/g.29387  ORF Transcript_21194/g.29387 Transcript_21194/m.29387 type:complete len:264 (+) Transcript_21194:8257-9048(+)
MVLLVLGRMAVVRLFCKAIFLSVIFRFSNRVASSTSGSTNLCFTLKSSGSLSVPPTIVFLTFAELSPINRSSMDSKPSAMDKCTTFLNTPSCGGRKDPMTDTVCRLCRVPLLGVNLKFAMLGKLNVVRNLVVLVTVIRISLRSLIGQSPNLRVKGDTFTAAVITEPCIITRIFWSISGHSIDIFLAIRRSSLFSIRCCLRKPFSGTSNAGLKLMVTLICENPLMVPSSGDTVMHFAYCCSSVKEPALALVVPETNPPTSSSSS